MTSDSEMKYPKSPHTATEVAEAETHSEHTWQYASYLWERSPDAPNGPGRAALSAIRRGAGREAGTVPELWPYQRHLAGDYRPDYATVAEHHALVLYGFHQQGNSTNVHKPGSSLGQAVWQLRNHFSPEAVDSRFFRAVTSSNINELAHHLRGLITQMRSLNPVPQFDYTQLVKDLRNWQYPNSVDRVRRRWGADYPRRSSN